MWRAETTRVDFRAEARLLFCLICDIESFGGRASYVCLGDSFAVGILSSVTASLVKSKASTEASQSSYLKLMTKRELEAIFLSLEADGCLRLTLPPSFSFVLAGTAILGW